jgi:CheY-like chemotaxis protein
VTQPTLDSTSRPITLDSHAALLQQLRRGVNALIGHCTDLTEDPAAGAGGPNRVALDNALTIARSMRALVNETLRGDAAVDTVAVDGLFRQLHNMRVLISDAISNVIRAATDSGTDPLFVAELRSARDVALSLMSDAGTAVFQAPEPDVSEAETIDSPFVVAPPVVARDKPRALCADDTPISLKAIRAYLKHLEYEVVTAENGRLALDIALANPGDFDVIITDLEMPEMTGFELLERLKASPLTREIPVIVISGLDDVASVVKCIKNGAEDHLTKPFDEVLLSARVGAVVERKRLRDREVEYLRRVDTVIEAARAAEAGTYESSTLAAMAGDADALGRLARVFDSMVSSVKEREKRLQERVQTLRQEVQSVRATTARGGGGSDNRAAPVLPSDTVFAGRYRIVKELGRGGMGMVYRAHDYDLDEDVAIKTVHPGLLEADPALGERFKTEARLARSLAHPNVVRTYDFGQSGNIHYLTMEFVEGVTLRQMIDTQGTLSIASTLAAGMQLAEALGVAHGAGIIHRDIKPDNLLLDENGVLKVMDFGVARPAGGKRLTEAGFVVGTMSYMAPEHLFGQEIDARADLYAAGVVLYECLTGVLPIDAANPYALAAKLSDEAPVPPQLRNAAVPQALSALVLRLLAKKRDNRPANAAELADRLREIH